MGQYWLPANLTKRETFCPHRLDSGLKLWEQIAAPNMGRALVILTAAMPEKRGGGDFDMDENWHGPERTFPKHNCSPGPMPKKYEKVAGRTIGRWAGDRISFVGDYGEKGDIQGIDSRIHAGNIYERAGNAIWAKEDPESRSKVRGLPYIDITEDILAVLLHELHDLDEFKNFKRWGEK